MTDPRETSPPAFTAAAIYPPPPPPDTVPSPPYGFLVPDMTGFRGWYPSRAELLAVQGAIDDLTSFADYSTVLGSSAPAPGGIVDALDDGLCWRTLRERTEAWDAYVRTRDGMAWRQAFTLLDDLKPLFTLAVAKKPDLAKRYPSLHALFSAPTVAAATSQKTRKKNTKAAEERDRAAPAASATPPNAARKPGKTVTVNFK